MTISNVGMLLSESARNLPSEIAVAVSRSVKNNRRYDTITFAELDRETDLIAAGLQAAGARQGMRLALLVKPGIEFIKLVFAMFKSGVVTILIDPGMGRKNMIRCLSEAEPEGFVAIPLAQMVRCFLRRRFPKASFNVTVGRRWFWGGKTLKQIKELGEQRLGRSASDKVSTGEVSTGEAVWGIKASDPAAVIFTTGSTGAPKGVLYAHRNFVKQAEEIRDFYQIRPGGIDVSGFPLFALFNAGMGVTTIVPKMDFTKPAEVDPVEIIGCTNDWKADQSFGSPALWTTVGRYCEKHRIRLESLKRVLTAGAPVPPHVLKRLKSIIAEDGEIYTPYGATEALPVASIDASTVLEETAELSNQGKGTCVGIPFPGIDCRVIEISDDPLEDISQTKSLPPFEVGELIVKGDVVTREYVTQTNANRFHKVADGDSFWHRMGDVGYLDQQSRFWFCGRKGHRVLTADRTLFTIPCESIFNNHSRVYRTALVGVGENQDKVPVLIIETWPEHRVQSKADEAELLAELKSIGQKNPLTQSIQKFLFIDKMPVDIRHNSKIFREKLTIWADSQLQ